MKFELINNTINILERLFKKGWYYYGQEREENYLV